MTEAAASRSGRSLFGYVRVCRRLLWKLLLWFVIASAVIVSLGRLLAPYADHARPLIERALAQALNQPVRIGRIEAQWPRLSPQIHLHDLSVGTAQDAMLQVDRARLELKLYNLVRPARNSFELVALGLNLALVEDDQGRWTWQIEGGGQVAGGWQRGLSAGDLKLRSSMIRVAPNQAPILIWDVPEADLNRRGDRLRIRFSAFERLELDPPESIGAEPAFNLNELRNRPPLEVRMQLGLSDDGINQMQVHLRNDRSRLPLMLARQFSHAFGQTFDPTAIQSLETATQVWLNWSDAEPLRLHAQIALSGLPDTAVTELQLDGYWRPDEWALEINMLGASAAAGEIQGLAFGMRDGYRALAIERLDLNALHGMFSYALNHLEFWPDLLEGQVYGLRAGWHPDGAPYRFTGWIEDLSFAVGEPSFRFSSLDLNLGLNGDRYRINISGRPELEWTFLYDRVVGFEEFGGEFELSDTGLWVNHLNAATDAFEFTAEGHMLWPDPQAPFAGPFMDLAIDLTRLESDNLRDWLPLRGIPRRTRSWLDQALIALDSGRALTTLHGWPLGWKRYTPPGAVHSAIDIRGLDLQYGRNWPRGENLTGRLEFESESMWAALESGTVAAAPLMAPEIRIRQMRNAEVELNLASDGATAEQLLELARALPLRQAEAALAAMQWRGEARALAQVWLPVRQRENWRLNGQIDLNGADFRLLETGFRIDGLNGLVPFNRDRFGPARVVGSIDDRPVELAFETRLTPEFSMQLESELPAEVLFPPSWRESWAGLIEPLAARMDGRSLWRMNLYRAPVATGQAQTDSGEAVSETVDERPLQLSLRSALNGTRLSLPAPLNKPAGQAWPFELNLPLGDWMQPVHLRLGEVLDGQVLIEPDFWQLGLGFGGEAARLPSAENFHITGNIDQLALSEWLDLIGDWSEQYGGFSSAAGNMDEALSGWLSLDVNQWWLGDTALGPIEMALAREEDFWRLNFDGESMAGNIRFPATALSLPVAVARFDHLYWPVSSEEKPPSEPIMVDPRGLPELQLMVDDFRWGDLNLGQMRLVSHAQQAGLEIEQFSIVREGLELAGSGRWVHAGDEFEFPVQTEARLRLTTDDLGTNLKQAGFELALERGRSVIELAGRWPGTPLDFSLTRINGDLDLLIDDGVIPEAQPGAGRVLGLVSLGSIPRRLRLDFSDVFGSGLGFDRVQGHFDLEQGIARTDDLSIAAPSADIRIQGEADLNERMYDQTMRVSPGLGSTLPIIGALTGGPIGAAAGVALEQLLNEPISGLSEIEYRVTGSWDEPRVETIGARGAPEPETVTEPEREPDAPENS